MSIILWAGSLALLMQGQPLYAWESEEEEESFPDEMDICLSIVKACVWNDVAKAIERHENVEDALRRHRLQSDVAEATRKHEELVKRYEMEHPRLQNEDSSGSSSNESP